MAQVRPHGQPHGQQRVTRTGELGPVDESPPEDGADRQLTGAVMPHER